MTDQTMQHPLIQLQGLSLRAPGDWERLDVPGTELVIAGPEISDAPQDFRPNLVVLTEPSSASIQQLSTRTMASAIADATSTYIASCNLWEAGYPARRIEFTHRVGPMLVDVVKHLFATPELAVELTFSCLVSERSAYAELANYIASSVEFTEEGR
ncbi:hypothetical protein [Arthrobacter castelli]|uniref:hypothetical protein n=1 Tax=Arthrobacter castelli TaxID=271431 RepID=UPI0003FD1283|nr:hypothetical protein [Arthrobacter castelli]